MLQMKRLGVSTAPVRRAHRFCLCRDNNGWHGPGREQRERRDGPKKNARKRSETSGPATVTLPYTTPLTSERVERVLCTNEPMRTDNEPIDTNRQ